MVVTSCVGMLSIQCTFSFLLSRLYSPLILSGSIRVLQDVLPGAYNVVSYDTVLSVTVVHQCACILRMPNTSQLLPFLCFKHAKLAANRHSIDHLLFLSAMLLEPLSTACL